MFAAVPTRIATCSPLLALVAVIASPALGRPPAGPTPSQVRDAVRSAEGSKRLWATVNVCDTRRHPNTIGIRGQVPALGFPASISIAITVEYFDRDTRRFAPAPGARRSISIGNVTDGIQQGGVTFQFPLRAGRLRGTATFFWKRGGKVIGRVDRLTTAGHRDADFSDPHGFSAATCTIN
jgi:hypothetical protein